MEFYKKLPRNKKEFALFIAIVSIISVFIMAPLVTCYEMGFRFDVWKAALRSIPPIWVAVVFLVLLTQAPAQKLTSLIVSHDDSFRSHIMAETLCTVFLMSIFLTVIGTWIGTGQISLYPIQHFFFKWPRNITLAFITEFFIAQPIARLAITKLHESQDSKAAI